MIRTGFCLVLLPRPALISPRTETPRLEGRRIYRFVFAERLFHWLNATTFLILAATGIALLFRWRFGLSSSTVRLLHHVHFGIGIVYFVCPAALLMMLNPTAARRWAAELFGWTRDDLRWLLAPFRRRGAPLKTGRFNAGQRLYLTFQIGGKWGLFATGLLMYLTHGVIAMFAIHVVLSCLLIFLALGHIYMGLVNPSTRASLSAMLSGYVDAEWLKRHHLGWFESLDRNRERSRPEEPR